MIKLKYSPQYAPIYATKDAVGADVRSTIEVVVPAHSTKIIPTGVYIDIEDGPDLNYEIQVRLRSSVSLKGFILANGVGTIDPLYPGEIGVILHNTTETGLTVFKGERIAQLVLSPIAKFANVEITSDERSEKGYGSTGVK